MKDDTRKFKIEILVLLATILIVIFASIARIALMSIVSKETVGSIIISTVLLCIVLISVINWLFDARVINRTKELKDLNTRLQLIINAIPDAIFKMDHEGTFIDSEVNGTDWLLADKDTYIGKNTKEVMPIAVAEESILKIKETLKTHKMTIQEYSLLEGELTKHYELRFVEGEKKAVYAILRDVTEKKQKQQQVKYLSYHDQLTDVYNRHFYEKEIKRLDYEIYFPISIAMVDVNGLKLVNDVFGHSSGDELLVRIANAIKSNINDDDILARTGGDEFVIILPNTTLKSATEICNRISKTIESEEINNIVQSVSIGLATKTSNDQQIEEVMRSAEDKMYSNKLYKGQEMREKTIEKLIATLKKRVYVEPNHKSKAMKLAFDIGKQLGLENEELIDLKNASRIHDIGEVCIDEEIFNKITPLTDSEYENIKKHAEKDYQLVKSVDRYMSISEAVLHHHERWDGKGYPKGLKGKEIPLISRIIAVADAYEAMTNERKYRQIKTKEEGILEMKEHSGTQFDAEVVEALIEHLDKM